MASLFRAAFPSGPLTDPDTGTLSAAWRGFFESLYVRTGGANGILSSDTAMLEAELEAERVARIAADAALIAGIGAERTARQEADRNEVTARQAGDAGEAVMRQNADALLVPIAQLCTMWANCNLSFLPTADPGSGKPWLDGIHIAVGTASGAMTGIGLEDGTGDWTLEDGSGHWLYG